MNTYCFVPSSDAIGTAISFLRRDRWNGAGMPNSGRLNLEPVSCRSRSASRSIWKQRRAATRAWVLLLAEEQVLEWEGHCCCRAFYNMFGKEGVLVFVLVTSRFDSHWMGVALWHTTESQTSGSACWVFYTAETKHSMSTVAFFSPSSLRSKSKNDGGCCSRAARRAGLAS